MRMRRRKRQMKQLCVVLSNKQRLDCTVEVHSIGRHVLDHVTLMCGVRSRQLFGLAVFLDNEYLFIDLDQKLGKYFGKQWSQTSRTATFVLFLRVHHYVQSDHVQFIEGCIAQELYYSDLRRKVLDSRCDHQEALFFQLAAAALQAEVGDAPEQLVEEEYEEDGKEVKKKTERKQKYFLPEDYFPSWLIKRRGRDYFLQHCPGLHGELRGLSRRQAIRRYAEDASALQDAPVTVYTLRQDKKAVRGCVQLGVTLKGLCLHQVGEEKPSLLYDCTWKEVHRLTIRGKRFEVQTGGPLGLVSRLVYYTSSPCHSRLILRHLQDAHHFQMAARRTKPPDTGAHAGRLYREAYIWDLAWLGVRLRSARSSRAEVEMSVDDPEEVLVDDPARVQRLVVRGVVPSSSCWAEMTMEMKQALKRKILTGISVD